MSKLSNKKRVLLYTLILLMLLLCGFGFNRVTVIVDTEAKHVYEYILADDILNDFADDTDAAEDKYKGGYYIISGRVESVSKKGNTISIYGATNTDNHIIGSCPKELRAKALEFQVGEDIGVYGKVSVDLIGKDVRISVEKLVPAPTGVKNGTFYLLGGEKIDANTMSNRELRNGRASYRIPAAWKGVEHAIKEEGIGTIEGYQYVLNALPGSIDTVPESFFVCYFDNASNLENVDDKKQTKLIENAIINNISGEGKGDSARSKDITTYYGAKYNYYIGSYNDILNAGENGYHVEYIFQKDGDEGLIMYLYIYQNPNHLSDILFVTRFLELNSAK